MKIKNFKQLAVNQARKNALLVAQAGLQAIDTEEVLKNTLQIKGNLLKVGGQQFKLNTIGKIIFVGIGKASCEAGKVFENILGNRLFDGIVLDVKKAGRFNKIRVFQGSHPLASNKNIQASKEIIKTLGGLRENDLVIFLISGGGSSLLCFPQKGTCQQDALLAKMLMRRGANIKETNIVRKHLSMARGGQLAKAAWPAKVISLIFSDVPGYDISVVASGPTYKDSTTVKDAKKILEKYKIWQKGDENKYGLIETPKEEKYFKKVKNILVLSNKTALLTMAEKAKELGLKARIVTGQFSGEAVKLGKKIAKDIRRAKKNTLLLYGGESTVKVRGNGRGGRNLELGLSALENLKDNEIVVTIASDGRDNGPFGGAVCDSLTKEAIKKAGLSIKVALKNNDTYPLFEKIGNYLVMGDTGSNISDLIIVMKT